MSGDFMDSEKKKKIAFTFKSGQIELEHSLNIFVIIFVVQTPHVQYMIH